MRPAWCLLFSDLAGCVQVLAGRPESPAFTLPILLFWTFAYPYAIKKGTIFKQWCILCLFIVGVAAIQLIPMAEMLSNSTRRFSTPFAFSSLSPKRLPELIIPQFLGNTCTISNAEFWGRRLEDMDPPLFLSVYWGLPVLFLALAGGISCRKMVLPEQIRRLLLFLFIGSIFLSLGKNLPFFEVMSRFPVIGLFRFPEKFLVAGVLPMALLASTAADEYFHRSFPNSRVLLIYLCCIVPIAVVLLLFVVSPGFTESFQNFFFAESGPHISEKLPVHFLQTLAVGLVILFLIVRRRRPAAWQTVALVAVMSIDLLWAGRFVNPFASREFWQNTPQLEDLVKKELQGGKLYREETYDRVLRAPSSDIFWDTKWNFEVLNYYTPTFYRISRIFHPDIDQMGAVQIQNLSNALHALPWNRRYPILRAAGVSVLLTHDNIDSPDVQKIAAIHNASNFVFILYRLSRFLPEVSFVSESRILETRLDALKVLADPQFDPHRTVVLFGKKSVEPAAPCGNATIQKQFAEPQKSIFRVDAPCSGYLVFTTPFYPGWKISIDAKETEVLRANYAFIAVRIEKGRHTVVSKYAPSSIFLGMFVSVCFLTILFLWRRIGSLN